jgi:hypothetical protein
MKLANEAVQWGNDKIIETFTEVPLVRLKINS